MNSTALFRFTVYLALVLFLCAVANLAAWLVQQAAVAVWPVVGPFLKAQDDKLLTVLLLAYAAVLFVAAMREDGRR
jgi:polyferredoxin